MRISGVLVLAAGLFVGGGATGQQPERPRADPSCSDDRGVDRCSAEQHRGVLALYGLPAIETYLAPGQRVRRIFYVDGYGRDIIAISFVRRPERDPLMTVHFPRREGEEPRPPMEAQVPEAVWQEIIRSSEGFDRDLEPPPAGSSDIAICMHSWVFTVEAADPPRGFERARARRKVQGACGVSLAARFAQLAYTRAVALLPHCAQIDQDDHRNPATLLEACSLLSGDRSAAAAALNAAEPLTRSFQADELGRVRRLFDWRGTIDWAGERIGGGEARSGTAWVSRVTSNRGTRFAVRRVHGLAADRVRMEGRLLRRNAIEGAASPTYEEAPVELIWVFGGTQTWEIESATVGAFAPIQPGTSRR